MPKQHLPAAADSGTAGTTGTPGITTSITASASIGIVVSTGISSTPSGISSAAIILSDMWVGASRLEVTHLLAVLTFDASH